MGNLGINCDYQSCALCDTCIYDEDYQEEDMEKTKKREKCNGCPFVYKLRVSTGTKCYHNYYCQNNPKNVNKLVDLSVGEGEDVKVPLWCPINMGAEDEKFMNGEAPKKKTWTDIVPQLTFAELEEGKVYHVPPYDNHARMDILITRKSEYSASYKVLNESRDTSYSINTLYPNTIIMRFITKHKIQNIEVKQRV